tara:strand:+ start:300 stop:941 length:642 start_codon:yes stop_codon:yes gene_type:complete
MQNLDTFESLVTVGMAIAAIIAGFIMFVIPYHNKIKKHSIFSKSTDYPEGFNCNIHTRLHERITELRVQNDCARTQIVQFHNGGQFLDGISMAKMTLTHESLATGTSSELYRKKDIPISMCIDGLNLLKENKAEFQMVDSLEDSWCKKFLQSSNVIAFSFLPLIKNKEIIGYVMCQWCSWSKADEVDETKMSSFLENSRNVIEIILEEQSGKK